MLRLTPLLLVFVALFSVIGATPSKRSIFEENATKLKELLRKGYLIQNFGSWNQAPQWANHLGQKSKQRSFDSADTWGVFNSL